MKRFLAVLAILALTGTSYAGQMRVDTLLKSDGSTSIEIGTATTVYTHSFPIKSGEYFGLAYKFTPVVGTPNMAIELEQSYELPTTEGASDTEWVEPDNMADVATSITTTTQHYISISPVPAPYARFKITNYGAGVWKTTFEGKIIVIEEN